MKHIILKSICTIGLLGVLLSSCQSHFPDEIQSKFESSKDVVSGKFSNAMLDLIKEQLKDFINSNDLKDSLGLTEEEQDELQDSLDSYLNSYEWNPEELEKTKQDIIELFNDVFPDSNFNITDEELNKKLDEILNQKSDL